MKILLAIDDSKFSKAATQALASQVRAHEAEVLVLQVVEPYLYFTPPQMALGYAPEMEARLKEQVSQANETVAHAVEMLRQAGFGRVESRVVEDDIRAGILNVAREWHADLIVLGSHGRKGIQRFLLGSVSEAVARHAPCSVEIVRDPGALAA